MASWCLIVLCLSIISQETTTTTAPDPPTAGKEKGTEKEWLSCDHAKKHYGEKNATQNVLLTKELKIKCNCPKHFDLHEYAEYNADYFKEAYMNGKDNYPSSCFACGQIFTTVAHIDPKDTNDADAHTFYKVDSKHLVRGCKNAFMESEPCTKAFCQSCWQFYCNMLQPKRGRRQTSALMPGETTDAHGNIVSRC